MQKQICLHTRTCEIKRKTEKFPHNIMTQRTSTDATVFSLGKPPTDEQVLFKDVVCFTSETFLENKTKQKNTSFCIASHYLLGIDSRLELGTWSTSPFITRASLVQSRSEPMHATTQSL